MTRPNDDISKFNTLLAFFLMKFRYFWSAQILITTKCSTGCRFCVYANVKKEDMPGEIIEKGFDLFQKLKIPRILISGGEPFESYDNLVLSLKKSLEFLPPKKVFLITSSSWANSREVVEKKFDPLVEMGLENLLMSIDAFHMENVNPKNYFLILDYLKETGVTPVILVRCNYKINMYQDLFEKIKNEYNAKIFTDIIVRTGGAVSLSIEETKAEIKDLKEFRNKFEKNDSKFYFFLKNPIRNIFTSMVRTTCVYPTLFPNGDLHLCCRKNENTKICNLQTDDFNVCFKEFNDNWLSNIRRILSQPLDCENCPISKLLLNDR